MRNPRVDSQFAVARTGLNAMRKMRGERVVLT